MSVLGGVVKCIPSIETVDISHSLVLIPRRPEAESETPFSAQRGMLHCERCELPDEGGDLRQCCWCNSVYCDSCLSTRGIDPKAEDRVCSTRCHAFNAAGLETNAAIEARFHLEGQNVAQKKNVVLVAANR